MYFSSSLTSESSGLRINSGAPKTNAPTSSNFTPDFFLDDENGNVFTTFSFSFTLYFLSNATAVWFLFGNALTKFAIRFEESNESTYLTSSSTTIVPSVIVPVLSRHNVSTLASDSTEYES